MNTILLCGSERETGLSIVLYRAIQSIHKSVLGVTKKSISLMPSDAQPIDFLLLESSSISKINMDRGIILFKQDSSGIQSDFDIPSGFVAIVDPQNETAIHLLQKNSVHTITCGLSQKDTVTFSSFTTDKAVVSLQREIHALNGKPVCPREIPVTLTAPIDDYSLLATVATLLLSDTVLPTEELSL